MSTNHTTNYDLNQWEGTDKVLRAEFNADNAKIDAALKANADAIAAEAAAREAEVPKIVTGIYTGNGQASQFISLGFTPKAVYVCNDKGRIFNGNGNSCYGGLALTGHPVESGVGPTIVEIQTGGFSVSYSTASSSVFIAANSQGAVYYYAALG